MKQYGIIRCPNCKAVKIIDFSYKTITCHRCGKRMQIENIKVLHRTPSFDEAQQVIGIINAEQAGQKAEFIKQHQSK